MKKTIGILMIALFVLVGCVGKKDDRVEENNNQGSTGYTYTISNLNTLSLVQMKFDKFAISVEKDVKVTDHLNLGVDELEKVDFEFYSGVDIRVTALNSDSIDKDEKIKELLESGSYTKTSIGDIFIEGEQKKAFYIKGEVNNINGKKDVLAFFITTANGSYVISRVAPLGEVKGLREVEILARTFVSASENGNAGTGGGIVNPDTDEVKYITAVHDAIKEHDINKMKSSRDDLINYVIRVYINDSTLTQEEKLKRASEFIFNWEINQNKILVAVNTKILDYYRQKMVLAKDAGLIAVAFNDTDKRMTNYIEEMDATLKELISQRILELKAIRGTKVSAERALNSLHEYLDYDLSGNLNKADILSTIGTLIMHHVEVLRIEDLKDNEKGNSIMVPLQWEYEHIPSVVYYGKLYSLLTELTSVEKEELFLALENENVTSRKNAKVYLERKAVQWLVEDSQIEVGATADKDKQHTIKVGDKDVPVPRTTRMVMGYKGNIYFENQPTFVIPTGTEISRNVKEAVYGTKYEILENQLLKYRADKTTSAQEELKNALVDYLEFGKYYDENVVIPSIDTTKTTESIAQDLAHRPGVTEAWNAVKYLVVE